MGKVCWGLGGCVCVVWCQGEVGYNLGGWCPRMQGTARVKPALLVLRREILNFCSSHSRDSPPGELVDSLQMRFSAVV